MVDCYFKVSARTSGDIGDAESNVPPRARVQTQGTSGGDPMDRPDTSRVFTWVFPFNSADPFALEKTRTAAEAKAKAVEERLPGRERYTLTTSPVRIALVTANRTAERRTRSVSA